MTKRSLLPSVLASLLFLLLSAEIAADIALVTHPANSLKTLDIADARRLFLKQTNEFPDGNHAQVAMLSKQSGVRRAFAEQVLNMSDSQLKTYWAKYIFTGQNRPPREFSSEEAMKHWIATTPGALGYLHVSEVDDSVKVLRTVSSDIPR
jgi:ABC-type phosphate transport system substrate-binding protein